MSNCHKWAFWCDRQQNTRKVKLYKHADCNLETAVMTHRSRIHFIRISVWHRRLRTCLERPLNITSQYRESDLKAARRCLISRCCDADRWSQTRLKSTFRAEPWARVTGSAQITGWLSPVTHACYDVSSGREYSPRCHERRLAVRLWRASVFVSPPSWAESGSSSSSSSDWHQTHARAQVRRFATNLHTYRVHSSAWAPARAPGPR